MRIILKSSKTWTTMSMVALVSGLFIGACASSSQKREVATGESASAQVVYARYNIHSAPKSSDKRIASYANFTDPGIGHSFVPLNSEIVIGHWKDGFSFRVKDDPDEYLFEFHKERMRMTVNEYIALITSPEPLSLDHFSDLDRKGIGEGKALIGMSKEGVMAALGYPAVHMTPSLDAKDYVYWRNRFAKRIISFDDQGLISGIEPAYN